MTLVKFFRGNSCAGYKLDDCPDIRKLAEVIKQRTSSATSGAMLKSSIFTSKELEDATIFVLVEFTNNKRSDFFSCLLSSDSKAFGEWTHRATIFDPSFKIHFLDFCESELSCFSSVVHIFICCYSKGCS